ncbi:MAG TPA: hypothetical protein VL485_17920 [Ktedonobacteraceae bacterium]|nr:hypothetical protein [Ktedonobacteraceae bacterium]
MQSSLMPGRMRLVLIVALALAGFFLLPSVSFASPLHGRGSTASFAFVGVTDPGSAGGAPIAGGLTITIGDYGYYHGQLHQPTGTQLSVSGLIEHDESLSVTIYSILGQPLIKGEGKYVADGKYTGSFHVYSGNTQLASGIWSAVTVDPDATLGLMFNAAVLKGTDVNMLTVGVLVLDRETLKGYLLEPDGTQVAAKAHFSNDKKDIKLSFKKGLITATGQKASSALVGPEKGYMGQFQGPASNDSGTWTAFKFSF